MVDAVDRDRVLRALVEPRRRAILELVAEREMPAGEIGEQFPAVTRSAVSQHLTVLKDAGLVAERKDGNRRLYRAREEGLAELQSYLSSLWSASLNLGKAIAENESGARERTDREAG
jgi:DNA-binding transcriptional ArsR family regulator